MNTMKAFYASISSPSQLRGPYLEALSKIARSDPAQVNALKSDLGWQEWGEQNHTITAQSA